MTYDYIGRITWVGESEECTGKIKRKVNIVIHTDDKRDLYMVIFDDNIEKLLGPVELNDKVSGSFSVKSVQFGQKWVTNLFCLTMLKVEPRQRKSRSYNSRDYSDWVRSKTDYFSSCRTAEEVKKRYRQLCKMYHPDTGTGNEKIMQEVNSQYNNMKMYR